MKILLISLLRNSHRNLSCLSLFSFLKKKGEDVKLLFIPDEKQYKSELLRAFISLHGFRLIGISVMTDMFGFASRITEDVKSAAPETYMVWGGIHPTLRPGECLEFADSVCIGEGELAFEALIDNLSTGADVSALPGIGVRLAAGDIVANHPRPRIAELDALPVVEYDWEKFFIMDVSGIHGFGKQDYIQYSNYNGEDYTLMTSRSCPFSCSYCCNNFLNNLYGATGVRRRGVEHVINEIHIARNNIKGIKFINFIDDQFLLSKKWNGEFVKRYKEEIGLPFIVRLTPGSFTENDLAELVDAGLKFVQIGIQSGSPKTQKEIFNRKFNREKILECSRLFRKYGVHPHYDVIIQNDFESDADRDETIHLLLELEKPFSLILFALTPFPETALAELYIKKGIKPRTDPYGLSYADRDFSDPYFQLASIIPHAPDYISEFFFQHRRNPDILALLNEYFHKTQKQRERPVTAQQS